MNIGDLGLGPSVDGAVRWVGEVVQKVGMHAKERDLGLLGSYAGLLGLAVFSIYTGAHGSLPREKPAAATEKTEGEESDDEDAEEESMERMSADDAWLFPIIGSVALGGLYLVVTYIGPGWVNWVLGWYFSIAGVGSVWNSSVSLARWIAGETRWKKYDAVKMSVKKGGQVVFGVSLRTPSAVLLPVAIVPCALYAFMGRRNAVLTDVLALSFAHNAISLLRLDSFRTGCILLGGLFVYDVWWVFGTEVMVKVATTLDVPIKLLWPKSVGGYTMLGLGDIVIPGTFIALALRYDPIRKRYFWAGLVGYVVGLVATMVVMDVYGHAQPALLYLSPACVLSFVITGLVSGELSSGWRWIDGP